VNTQPTKLARVLASAPHVFLDFDGPVCAVFGGTSDRAVADVLRTSLDGLAGQVPPALADSNDPFDVLRFAATLGPEPAAKIEERLAQLEVGAVATATPTPGAREAIIALRQAQKTATIVSNNSVASILAYLDRHALAPLITGVIGRSNPSPALLKPHPHLLQQAIHARRAQPGECVLIGDSATDIQAARAAHTTVIAYANKPGKVGRFASLRPDAVITGMLEIADVMKRCSVGERAKPR
jgi:HAD superfamily hydrolase (TIGR01509 family)